jgi:hypothetical protein
MKHMERGNLMTQLKFVGKISDMGDRKVIYIPKGFYKQVEKFQGETKQVQILIDAEI